MTPTGRSIWIKTRRGPAYVPIYMDEGHEVHLDSDEDAYFKENPPTENKYRAEKMAELLRKK